MYYLLCIESRPVRGLTRNETHARAKRPGASGLFLEKMSQFLPEHQVDPIRQAVDRFDSHAAKEAAEVLLNRL